MSLSNKRSNKCKSFIFCIMFLIYCILWVECLKLIKSDHNDEEKLLLNLQGGSEYGKASVTFF